MKIYELPDGDWVYADDFWHERLPLHKLRQIDPDPSIAHSIELDSCTAVITAESCYFRDAAAPVITLEEMQRVTKCMEMLREAGE